SSCAPTTSALHRLTPGELSELVADLPPQRAAEALDAVGSARAAAAVSIVRPGLGSRLVGALPSDVAARTLDAMPVDDAAAVPRRRARGGAPEAPAAPPPPLPLAALGTPCGALAGSPPSRRCWGRAFSRALRRRPGRHHDLLDPGRRLRL